MATTLKTNSTKKKNNLSVVQVTRLKQLRRQIVDGHEATEKLIKSSRDKAREALKEALLCGKALVEVKSIVPFGSFLRWIAENCKGVSNGSVHNYMTLHNSFGKDLQHVGKLPATSLRKAYLELGIISEEPEPAATIATPAVSSVTDKALSTTVRNNTLKPNGKTIKTKTRTLAITPAEPQAATIADKPKTDFLREQKLAYTKSLTDTLLNDLINKLTGNEFTLDELEAASLAIIQQWFAAQRNTGVVPLRPADAPPRSKESFSEATANAGS